MGIDPQKFTDTLQKPEVRARIKSLEERYKGVKVIVGVDRLDHIKGLTQKLKGFDAFLDDNHDLRNKVVLIQVAVPSREDVKEYQELETEISTIAGKINGKHGSSLMTTGSQKSEVQNSASADLTSNPRRNSASIYASFGPIYRTSSPVLNRRYLSSHLNPRWNEFGVI